MTGGARGYCVSPGQAGTYYRGGGGRAFLGREFGRGYGRGMGRGFGWRASRPAGVSLYYANPSSYPLNAEQELSMLKNDAEMLKAELKGIHEHIAALEKLSGQEG
jgi:hypothetical protein